MEDTLADAKPTGPYGLDADHRGLVERILGELNREAVMVPLKKRLDEVCQHAIDQTTDYLTGEYQLVLEQIVRDRAERMVRQLLLGSHEMAVFFNLEQREISFGPDRGKPFVYDPDGVRAAILHRFKDQIINAELLGLQEEVARMRDSLKFLREQRY